jgi:hypothetical protein
MAETITDFSMGGIDCSRSDRFTFIPAVVKHCKKCR